MPRILSRFSMTVLLLACMHVCEARVTRIIVETREAMAPARPNGLPYEILRGHFDGDVDPLDAHNTVITDLEFAPRDAKGRVSYSATFAIAVPTDLSRASGVLWYEVPNRGNAHVAADADGNVRVISGWQGDIAPNPDLQTATVPVAKGKGGAPITGAVFSRFTDMPRLETTLPNLGGIGRGVARPIPVSLDSRRSRLFRQSNDQGPLIDIAPRDWAFADCHKAPFPGLPDATKICVRGGFDPSAAYGLVYQGKDPKVLALGFAATRDLISFLRYAQVDDGGNSNPLAGAIRWAIATGTSQSGNYIRSFINLGFNADESARVIFDGANPNIAGRQVPLNVRFGVPGGAASPDDLGSEGSLWWAPYEDRYRRRGTSSLLDRCNSTHTCPKIMETFGSAELWGLHMSPDLIGTDGRADIPLPDNVRRYYFPSVTHGGSYSGGFPVKGDAPYPGAPRCLMAQNPNPSNDTLRALQKRLVAWVVSGVSPPTSRYPTIAAGELAVPTPSAMGWRAIPGAQSPEGKINVFFDYDVGNGFHYSDLSGVASRQPPRIRGIIPQLVPRVNEDDNETSGVPSVQLLVPIGTYTGWNVLAEGYGRGGGCGFSGGFIPFAQTRSERIAINDPRPSLEERYQTHQGFIDQVRRVAAARVKDGWLLSEDAERLIQQAEASKVLSQ